LDHHKVRGAKQDFVVGLAAPGRNGWPPLLDRLGDLSRNRGVAEGVGDDHERPGPVLRTSLEPGQRVPPPAPPLDPADAAGSRAQVLLDIGRSEEHTSELQSRGHLVCRLLLEKKKQHTEEYFIMKKE